MKTRKVCLCRQISVPPHELRVAELCAANREISVSAFYRQAVSMLLAMSADAQRDILRSMTKEPFFRFGIYIPEREWSAVRIKAARHRVAASKFYRAAGLMLCDIINIVEGE